MLKVLKVLFILFFSNYVNCVMGSYNVDVDFDRGSRIILHIAKKSQWENSGEYYGNFSIERDGFIHCATVDQLLSIAEGNLRGEVEALVILELDYRQIEKDLRWEVNKKSGKIFPHLYGLIKKSYVREVIPFERGEGGEFLMPEKFL